MSQQSGVLEGGCACGRLRYELRGRPLIVHACHCRNCQKLSGSGFGVNIWTEAENVVVTAGAPRTALIEGGESGQPNEISFCENCGTTVWCRYHASPGDSRFVRAGTLDDPDAVTPDVHIFTRSKRHWTEIPAGARTFEAFYDLKSTWPPGSIERLRAMMKKPSGKN